MVTVFWTQFAKDKLSDIFDYYEFNVNASFANQLIYSIIDYTDLLVHHYEIGQIELLLEDRPQEFRYLVFKNYKIIYWNNSSKNRIDIVHVFDTRQNPKKLLEILRD